MRGRRLQIILWHLLWSISNHSLYGVHGRFDRFLCHFWFRTAMARDHRRPTRENPRMVLHYTWLRSDSRNYLWLNLLLILVILDIHLVLTQRFEQAWIIVAFFVLSHRASALAYSVVGFLVQHYGAIWSLALPGHPCWHTRSFHSARAHLAVLIIDRVVGFGSSHVVFG